MSEEKSNDIKALIIYAFIALLVVIFVFYIYFANKNKFKNEETPTQLKVTYKGDSSFNFEKMDGKFKYKLKLKVNNPTDKTITYNFMFDKLINSVNSSDLNYSLFKNGKEVISNTRMPLSGVTLHLLNNVKIKSGNTEEYELIINYTGKELDKKLNGTIKIEEIDDENSDFIKTLKKEYRGKNSEIGVKIANTDEGFIRIKDDYYYRGKHLNNYLSFAGQAWRIVGINSDDTLRIVLDSDTMLTSVWSNKDENNYDESEVKKKVEEWYQNSIGANYSEYVSISEFCKNYAIEDYLYSYKKYKTNINSDYFMNCKKTYKLPVGVLNENEVMYAGGIKNILDSSNNTWYYLYTPRSDTWLISNSYKQNNKDLNSYISKEDGSIRQAKMDEEFFIKPVISLNKNIKVAGSGASNDPYIVTTE